MAQRFIACDREQSFLMPPDVREWLPEDHFAWFVLGAVDAMDLAAFYGAYRADGRSRPAFDPSMMVARLACVGSSALVTPARRSSSSLWVLWSADSRRSEPETGSRTERSRSASLAKRARWRATPLTPPRSTW
jgi:hypothetical protein